MTKRVFQIFLIIFFIVLLSLPMIIGYSIFSYSPSEDRILDYVEDLIGQDMDIYDCEIIDHVFSTNIREYSLYAVVQINSPFDVNKFESGCVYPIQIQQLLHKVYGTNSIPQCCFYIVTDDFCCVFDQNRNWLIINHD